jgi:hypothetical protein
MNWAGPLAAAIFALALTASASAQQADTPPAGEAIQREPFSLEDIARALENGNGVRASGIAGRTDPDDRIRYITRQHMRTCWSAPADATNAEPLIVTVQFELNEDGTLRGQPRVTEPRGYAFNPSMRRAVRGAMRAVRACSPYPFPADSIAAQHYDRWREMEFSFYQPPSRAAR